MSPDIRPFACSLILVFSILCIVCPASFTELSLWPQYRSPQMSLFTNESEDVVLCRSVGLWRASVVAVQVEQPDRRSYTSRPGYASQRGSATLRLLVGDDSGARSLLILPYNRRYYPSSCQLLLRCSPAQSKMLSLRVSTSSFEKQYRELCDVTELQSCSIKQIFFCCNPDKACLCRYDDIQVGEAAEVLVLSPQAGFNSFKVSLGTAHQWPACDLLMHTDLWYLGMIIDRRYSICKNASQMSETRNSSIIGLIVEERNIFFAGAEGDLPARNWNLAFRLPSHKSESIFGDQLRHRA